MLTLPEGKFWYLRSDLGINTQKTLFEHTSVDSQSYQEILQVQAVAEHKHKGEKKSESGTKERSKFRNPLEST